MTQSEALKWIGDLFEERNGGLRPETRREEVEAWDSLGVLTLMAGLDSDLGVTVSDEELQDIETVGHILDLLKRYGQLADGEPSVE